jgi:hypothetical protein
MPVVSTEPAVAGNWTVTSGELAVGHAIAVVFDSANHTISADVY